MMLALNGKVRVFLYAGTCDMRRQIAGLMTLVREELGRDRQCGDLYVFRGRRGDQIRMLLLFLELNQSSAQPRATTEDSDISHVHI